MGENSIDLRTIPTFIGVFVVFFGRLPSASPMTKERKGAQLPHWPTTGVRRGWKGKTRGRRALS